MDDMLRRTARPKIGLNSASVSQPEADAAVMTLTEPLAVAKEQISSSNDEYTDESDNKPAPKSGGQDKPPKKKRKLSWKVPTPKTKKQWIIAAAVMVLLLGGAGFSIYWFIIRKDTAPVVIREPVPEPEPAPEPIYSRMTGREITNGDINKRPVYAVQIENSPEARPQSGLREADIVFEAVAEGGITRFNAIYHDNIPSNLGPVRSLRPYFMDWFMPFDAAIVHAGGSPEALADVRAFGLKDMDSVSSIMRRISERYSPHNYYTRGQQVLDLAVERQYTSTFNSLPRKQPPQETEEESPQEAEAAPAYTAAVVNVRISSTLYNLRYAYDPASGKYNREMGGAAHVDADSGQQIAPDVVIVPILSKGIHPDRVHTTYGTVGSGKVYVFQEGQVTEGTWHKASRTAQWELKDAAGETIELNPGQTWFSITDAAGNVTFSP